MTTAEKREAIRDFCDSQTVCSDCPHAENEYCEKFGIESADPKIIDEWYDLYFSEERTLISIPKDGQYIEILGHKIDGFESFEAFCEHLNKYAKLEAENERLRSVIKELQKEVKSLCRILDNVQEKTNETV